MQILSTDTGYDYTPDGSMSNGVRAWQGGWGGGAEDPYFLFTLTWDPAVLITSAFLVGVCGGNDIDHTGAVVKSLIYGDLELNPVAPTTGADYMARPQTVAQVPWDVGTPPDSGALLLSPDISSILTELVHQPGWVSGNSVQILIVDNGSDGFTDLEWPQPVTLFINEAPPTPPSIASFTPVSGDNGSVVVITGNAFTGASAVAIGGAPMASFAVNSDTQITAVLPALAISGPISVTTSVGTASSATSFIIPPSVRVKARVNDLGDGSDGTAFVPSLIKLTDQVLLMVYPPGSGAAVVEAQSGGDPNSGFTTHNQGMVKALAIGDTVVPGPGTNLDVAASSGPTGNLVRTADQNMSPYPFGSWTAGAGIALAQQTVPSPPVGTYTLKITYTTNFGFVTGADVATGIGGYSVNEGDQIVMTVWVRSDPANVTTAPWMHLRLTAGTLGARADALVSSSGWTQLTAKVVAPNNGGNPVPLSWEVSASRDQSASQQILNMGDVFYAAGISYTVATGPRGVNHAIGARLNDTHALVVYEDLANRLWAVVVYCPDPAAPCTIGPRTQLDTGPNHANYSFSSVSGSVTGSEIVGMGDHWAIFHSPMGKAVAIVTDGDLSIVSSTQLDRSYSYPAYSGGGLPFQTIDPALSADDSQFVSSVGNWVASAGASLASVTDGTLPFGGPKALLATVTGATNLLQLDLPVGIYPATDTLSYTLYLQYKVTGPSTNKNLQFMLVDDTGATHYVTSSSGSIGSLGWTFGYSTVQLAAGATSVGIRATMVNQDNSNLAVGTTLSVGFVVMARNQFVVPASVIRVAPDHYVLVESIGGYNTTLGPQWLKAWMTAVTVRAGTGLEPPLVVEFHPSAANPREIATNGQPYGNPLQHIEGWSWSTDLFRQALDVVNVQPAMDVRFLSGEFDDFSMAVVLDPPAADTPPPFVDYANQPLIASFDGGRSRFIELFQVLTGSDPYAARYVQIAPDGVSLIASNVTLIPSDLALLFFTGEAHMTASLDDQALVIFAGTGHTVDSLLFLPAAAPPPPPPPPPPSPPDKTVKALIDPPRRRRLIAPRVAPTHASNAPISVPILYPDYELVDMQGFAFTQHAGIVVQYVEAEDDWRKKLSP